MQDETHLNPPERELESALKGLQPAAVSISRDELLFRAGQRSVTARLWIWRTAALAAAAAVAMVLFLRPSPTPTQRLVYVDRVIEKRELVPVSASEQPAAADSGARVTPQDLRRRQLIMRFGLDALPVQVSAAPVHDSLDRVIGIQRRDLGVGGILLRQFGQQKGGL